MSTRRKQGGFQVHPSHSDTHESSYPLDGTWADWHRDGSRASRPYWLLMDEPLTDQELSELEALTKAATPSPWVAMIEGPGIAGDSMIWLGTVGFGPDMYIHHDDKIAPSADIEFIAAARTYMPRLLAELRHRRRQEP